MLDFPKNVRVGDWICILDPTFCATGEENIEHAERTPEELKQFGGMEFPPKLENMKNPGWISIPTDLKKKFKDAWKTDPTVRRKIFWELYKSDDSYAYIKIPAIPTYLHGESGWTGWVNSPNTSLLFKVPEKARVDLKAGRVPRVHLRPLSHKCVVKSKHQHIL